MDANAGLERVLVVGAGIGGAATALWLRRLGLEVRLFERRRKEEFAEGAFLGLAPNGVRVLRQLSSGWPRRSSSAATLALAFSFSTTGASPSGTSIGPPTPAASAPR
jgi:2-polyprenyl-6-methoxyphenol hydroxylase-like FAD-dependent oxidoreductase